MFHFVHQPVYCSRYQEFVTADFQSSVPTPSIEVVLHGEMNAKLSHAYRQPMIRSEKRQTDSEVLGMQSNNVSSEMA